MPHLFFEVSACRRRPSPAEAFQQPVSAFGFTVDNSSDKEDFFSEFAEPPRGAAKAQRVGRRRRLPNKDKRPQGILDLTGMDDRLQL